LERFKEKSEDKAVFNAKLLTYYHRVQCKKYLVKKAFCILQENRLKLKDANNLVVIAYLKNKEAY